MQNNPDQLKKCLSSEDDLTEIGIRQKKCGLSEILQNLFLSVNDKLRVFTFN